MTATARLVITAAALAAFGGMLSGCQKEGPAERAGKEIDNAVKKVTQRIEWGSLGQADVPLAYRRAGVSIID